MNKLDQQISQLTSKIEDFVVEVTGKILLAETGALGEDGRKPSHYVSSNDEDTILYCRNYTLNRYLPTVRLQQIATTFNGDSENRSGSFDGGPVEDISHLNSHSDNLEIPNDSNDSLKSMISLWEGNSGEESVEPGRRDIEFKFDISACQTDEVSRSRIVKGIDISVAPNGSGIIQDKELKHEEELGYEGISDQNISFHVKTLSKGSIDTGDDSPTTAENSSLRGSSRTRASRKSYITSGGCETDCTNIGNDSEFEPEEDFSTRDESTDSNDDEYLRSVLKKQKSGKQAGKTSAKTMYETIQIGENKFQYRGFTYEVLENGRYKCNHCTNAGNNSSKNSVTKHIVHYHIKGEGRTRRNRIPIVKINDTKFLYGDSHTYTKVDGGFQCGQCSLTRPISKHILLHIRHKHMEISESNGISKKKRKNEEPEPSHQTTKKYKPLRGDGTSSVEYHYEKVGDTFQCSTCEYTSKSTSTMRKHIRYRHASPEMKHVCEICGKGFQLKSLLLYHQVAHSSVQHFTCEICGKNVKQKQSLQNHMRRCHNEIIGKQYTCETCGGVFTCRAHLIKHNQTVHSFKLEKKPPIMFTCLICDETLPRHRKTRHMRFHNNQRYECSKCSNSYTRKRSLRDHMSVHEKSMKYTCETCDMRFNWKASLYKHIKRKHDINSGSLP
ncbi:unnamed protein product [Allacma fusca]|uniref:C2H2-type domain-containing protein n=1 Tax=Allacma fusca TaxID=39272 RepID=A0A8J2K7Q6_9HEXA|nr:unnamed protein product [Allacma fusca]